MAKSMVQRTILEIGHAPDYKVETSAGRLFLLTCGSTVAASDIETYLWSMRERGVIDFDKNEDDASFFILVKSFSSPSTA